jgi:hypothetical protein
MILLVESHLFRQCLKGSSDRACETRDDIARVP